MTIEEILAAAYPQERGTSMADGYPGHFILADRCHFHLHHHILSMGGQRYRVSTVGNLLINDDDAEFSRIGASGMFETMAFKEDSDGEPNYTEIRTVRSEDSLEATRAHYALVEEFVQ